MLRVQRSPAQLRSSTAQELEASVRYHPACEAVGHGPRRLADVARTPHLSPPYEPAASAGRARDKRQPVAGAGALPLAVRNLGARQDAVGRGADAECGAVHAGPYGCVVQGLDYLRLRRIRRRHAVCPHAPSRPPTYSGAGAPAVWPPPMRRVSPPSRTRTRPLHAWLGCCAACAAAFSGPLPPPRRSSRPCRRRPAPLR